MPLTIPLTIGYYDPSKDFEEQDADLNVDAAGGFVHLKHEFKHYAPQGGTLVITLVRRYIYGSGTSTMLVNRFKANEKGGDGIYTKIMVVPNLRTNAEAGFIVAAELDLFEREQGTFTFSSYHDVWLTSLGKSVRIIASVFDLDVIWPIQQVQISFETQDKIVYKVTASPLQPILSTEVLAQRAIDRLDPQNRPLVDIITGL